MLDAIIRFSLRHRPFIIAGSLLVLALAGMTAFRLPVDVFPDLDRPRVVIMTEAQGMAASDVETQITAPLEVSLLGATGVRNVRSESSTGLSVINVEFDWGASIHLARQVVQERLSAAASSLPKNIEPQLAPISSILGQILLVGLMRAPGPHGGLLVPVEGTPYWAECQVDADQGHVVFAVWDPRVAVPGDANLKKAVQLSRDPGQWQPVPLEQETVELGWSELLLPPLTLTSTPQKDLARFQTKNPGVLSVVVDNPDAEASCVITLQGKSHRLVFSRRRAGMDLRTLADWVVRPRILLPGVAQVTVLGGGRKQYQVLIDPQAAFQHGVTLEEVETALRNNNLDASGGFIERGSKEWPIRVFARLGPEPEKILAQLKRLPIKHSGRRVIHLEQVASRIMEGPQPKRGDSSVDGFPGVLLTVNKQPSQDTREVTERILAALKDLEASLPLDVRMVSDVFQMKGFIDRGIHNVSEALVLGAVLVLIVLFLFLLNFRTTFISLTAIPLSLALSMLVFSLVGWVTGTPLTINVMVLGGLAVAMGELVDDAIVDVENIFRRLKENRLAGVPRSTLQVVYEASVEIRGAIVFGTLVVILVFVPLLALPGIEGRLFTPLAVAYILSILASLLVSLTVTPVLSYYLLPRVVDRLCAVSGQAADGTNRNRADHGDSPLLRFLKRAATPFIRLSMARPGWLLAGAWILVGLAVWQMTRLGSNFLPEFDEGSVQVNLSLPPGASLEASNLLCARADDYFRTQQKSARNKNGLILHFVRQSGRAELDEHVEPVSSTHYILAINPDCGKSRTEVLRTFVTDLKGDAHLGKLGLFPYADVEAEQPLAHLISHMLSGVTAQMAVKIYGEDLETLRRLAGRVKMVLADVKGVTPPVVEPLQLTEEIQVRLRDEELSLLGLDREHVARSIQLALQGQVVSQTLQGQKRFDLVVRLDDPYRNNVEEFQRLRLDVPGQRTELLLGDVAEVSLGLGPNIVKRDNGKRRLVVRCNVSGRDLGSVASEIQQQLTQRLELPTGYHLELGGQFQSQRQATWRIGLLSIIAFVGMVVVLYVLFPSLRVVLQIVQAVFIAFIGGVLALTLTGQTLTVAALVGFVSLGGIAVRNGILLVTHYVHLMRHEGEGFTKEMILRGSLERLAPVLMTALTAGIALIPLVVGGQQPGREILYPVATVILGGLVTCTLGEFLLHPGLFWAFSGQDAPKLAAKSSLEEGSE